MYGRIVFILFLFFQLKFVSDSETIVDCPQRLGDVVSIQVLLRVIPTNGVEAVFDLENHGREGAHCGQIALPVDRLVVCVEDEDTVVTHQSEKVNDLKMELRKKVTFTLN